MNFWDSSAIVPCLIAQRESETVRLIFDSDPVVVVWWAGRIECASALCRERREGHVSVSSFRTAMELLEQLWSTAFEIAPSERVRQRAERLLGTHSLRAADALHLAAALICVQEMPQLAGFVSLDERLRAAAGQEGFKVLPIDFSR